MNFEEAIKRYYVIRRNEAHKHSSTTAPKVRGSGEGMKEVQRLPTFDDPVARDKAETARQFQRCTGLLREMEEKQLDTIDQTEKRLASLFSNFFNERAGKRSGFT